MIRWLLLLCVPLWGESVQTPEDAARSAFYRESFESGRQALALPSTGVSIPKVLHFVWLGPQPFPEACVGDVKSWMEAHPDWKVKFWTDLDRPSPVQGMEKHLVRDFPFAELSEYYDLSDNFGEKSLVLRYEILYREGGLYADVDTRCLAPVDALHEKLDFYCGLEALGPSVLSSAVFPSPHLVACKARHPILKEAMEWLAGQWAQLEAWYPGADARSVFNRVQHRAVAAFDYGVRSALGREENRDLVFPQETFSLPVKAPGRFAMHRHLGSWHCDVSEGERQARQELTLLERQNRYHLGLLLALLGLNGAAIGYWLRKRCV